MIVAVAYLLCLLSVPLINSTAPADPELAFLGEIIATPASWPVTNVYSVGDL